MGVSDTRSLNLTWYSDTTPPRGGRVQAPVAPEIAGPDAIVEAELIPTGLWR